MTISVIISTKERPVQISDCIRSLLKNTDKIFEIIVIDQSQNDATKSVIEAIKAVSKTNIIYRKIYNQGLSRSRNTGIETATGDYFAFTDDDCLVSSDWIANIIGYFRKNPGIGGVFGASLPYKPYLHRNQINPATFFKPKPFTASDHRIVHYECLGLGNNMILKKELFRKVGLFKTWLGAGSLSVNGADESELIYRILSNGYKLAYSPKIIIRHNRWISKLDWEYLRNRYEIGNLAFFTYWCLKNRDSFLFGQIIRRKYLFCDRIRYIMNRIKSDSVTAADILLIPDTIYTFFRGFFIGTTKLIQSFWGE
jgi:glycosyltransferase involved in cell wall biosynthesis